ncbi:MAG TPA: hypothetical protein VNM40_02930 [Candidatus Paceibacterota bacterium]|nr:hypothetical protein [Candidatus Paceibacterota bacterium]
MIAIAYRVPHWFRAFKMWRQERADKALTRRVNEIAELIEKADPETKEILARVERLQKYADEFLNASRARSETTQPPEQVEETSRSNAA